ncbi:MAG: ornithine cyclodeaminase family protein [Candidatus Micrarchaeia archaeon]
MVGRQINRNRQNIPNREVRNPFSERVLHDANPHELASRITGMSAIFHRLLEGQLSRIPSEGASNITDLEASRILSMERTLVAVEAAYTLHGLGKVEMPPKVYVNLAEGNAEISALMRDFLPNPAFRVLEDFIKHANKTEKPIGDFRAMPCAIPPLGISAVKIVNVHPQNPQRYGMPSVMAKILLINPNNGSVYFIADGAWITAMRTGAASGVAAKFLSPTNVEHIGFVGAGVQATTQLWALKKVRPSIKSAYYFDVKEANPIFLQAAADLGVEIERRSLEETVRNAEILITTTPSKKPVILKKYIGKNSDVLILAVGADAPGKQELSFAITCGKRTFVYVDDFEQATHSGEVNNAVRLGRQINFAGSIGEAIVKPEIRRLEGIRIADFTGLAILDAATTAVVYELHRGSSSSS